MSETDSGAWSGPQADLPNHRPEPSVERELALVDRVLGLEARVAELSVSSSLHPSEQLLVEQELARLRSSVTWRTGRIVSAPLRVALRVVRGGRGGSA